MNHSSWTLYVMFLGRTAFKRVTSVKRFCLKTYHTRSSRSGPHFPQTEFSVPFKEETKDRDNL